MWRVVGGVAAILFGVALTFWEMYPRPVEPYDTWSISEAEALDVAEAVLRYQIENELSAPRAKKLPWLMLVYGDMPSTEFLARFQDYPQVLTSLSQLNSDKDVVLFLIRTAERIDDTTILVLGKPYDEKGSKSKGLIGDPTMSDLTHYRVIKQGDIWEVAEATSG